jgi:hypothetical protein
LIPVCKNHVPSNTIDKSTSGYFNCLALLESHFAIVF